MSGNQRGVFIDKGGIMDVDGVVAGQSVVRANVIMRRQSLGMFAIRLFTIPTTTRQYEAKNSGQSNSVESGPFFWPFEWQRQVDCPATFEATNYDCEESS